MSDFVPYKIEEKSSQDITNREANLIYLLRRFEFGKFTIHKTDGKIIRAELQESRIVEDKQIDLS